MSIINIKELILAETSEVELKESLEIDKPKSWLKSVSVFANTNVEQLYGEL